MLKNYILGQGRRQKNFQGRRGSNGKEDRKIAKKDRKIALLSLFQQGRS